MKKFLSEFKEFALRGNVLDMAIGVVIGGAFGKITTSLVNDILNPILGIIAGNNTALAAMAVELPGGGALMVGNFINAILNFLIMAFAVFCLVKALNRLHRKRRRPPHLPRRPPRKSCCSQRSGTC